VILGCAMAILIAMAFSKNAKKKHKPCHKAAYMP
jgi:hypothetical protein